MTFALSLVDALLFVHYAAVLLLEIRQMPPRYYLHVIRSPDGISKGYPIGAVSLNIILPVNWGKTEWILDIDTTSRRLAPGQVLHGFPDLQSVPGASASEEDPFQVAPLVVFQVLRPGRPEQRVHPAGDHRQRDAVDDDQLFGGPSQQFQPQRKVLRRARIRASFEKEARPSGHGRRRGFHSHPTTPSRTRYRNSSFFFLKNQ